MGARRLFRMTLAVVALLILSAMPGLIGRSQASAAQTIDCSVLDPAPASAGPKMVERSLPFAERVDFPDGGGELTVFAAASLTDAFERIATDLEAAHDGLDITYNFAGSQALVTQLAEGAEADVFASANRAQMEAALADDSLATEPAVFVLNRLMIVVPIDNPAGIAAPVDLAEEGLRLVLAQAEVPAGRYARVSLCLMGTDAAIYGEGFVDRVAANVVSEEEDVRDVLAKVQLGEADAGIVYKSDAAAAPDQVRAIDMPNEVNPPAAYSIAAVAGGDRTLAQAFIGYLLSDEGQATLVEFGFDPLSSLR